MDHKERVQSHYDAHAGNNVSRQEQLQQRRQGAALPLKVFHNDIKRRLIAKFAPKGCSLLDLCCGRGGDLQKWRDAGIRYVYGVDISPNEVAEATRRFAEMQQDHARRKRPLQLEAQFERSGSLGDEEFEADGGPFDVVTCMFAMHYFFESEHKLRMFLRNVSRNLKPGGVFIGTIPDGKRILWHLAGRKRLRTAHLTLEKRWPGEQHKEQPFGNKYLWSLSDTVTAGVHERTEGSEEFLTFLQPILRIAAHYDMLPVTHYEDPQLDSLFEVEDVALAFKHFCPQFPSGTDPSLAIASSTFMAFVFKKIEEGEEMPMLEPPLPKALPYLDAQWQGQGADAAGRSPPEEGEEREAKRPRTTEPPEEGEDGAPAPYYGEEEEQQQHYDDQDTGAAPEGDPHAEVEDI